MDHYRRRATGHQSVRSSGHVPGLRPAGNATSMEVPHDRDYRRTSLSEITECFSSHTMQPGILCHCPGWIDATGRSSMTVLSHTPRRRTRPRSASDAKFVAVAEPAEVGEEVPAALAKLRAAAENFGPRNTH